MKRAYFVHFFFFFHLTCFSQINENFNATSLSSMWVGEPQFFQIVSNKLQSKGSTVSGQSIYLSAGNELINETEWSFLVDLQFAPSSSNYARIYLTASDLNLSSSTISGYYVQIGESNQDTIKFYKQNGAIRTNLAASKKVCFSSSTQNYEHVRIKIIRDLSGNWKLYSDCAGGTNYQLDDQFFDNTFTSSSFAGFNAIYSTTSRAKLFNFDDFYIGPIIPDLILPSVVGINVLNANSLEVVFSENVYDVPNNGVLNFSIENGTIVPVHSEINPNDFSKINLTFAGAFFSDQTNVLSITGLSDLAGNGLSNSIFSFVYSTPTPQYIAQFREIVINEIFADPTPAVDLPDLEYLELYNRTKQTIALQNYVLQDGTVDRVINYPVSIIGNSYLVLCSSVANKNLLEAQFPTIQVCTLASLSLSNSTDQFILKTPNQTIVDRVSYTDDWYKDATKKAGGWSLEQINPNSPCSGFSNWSASIHQEGGTPGKVNSIYNTTSETIAPTYSGTRFLSNTQFLIGFNEQMDSTALKNTLWGVTSNSIASTTIKRPSYDSVLITLNTPLTEGVSYILSSNGAKDCYGNALLLTKISIGIGRAPDVNEVIINEILADETPSVGLPQAEFIELFNTTNALIDIGGMILTDATTSSMIPFGSTIAPFSYLILCSSSDISKFNSFGHTVGLNNFPTFTNTGERVVLKSMSNKEISAIDYQLNWYNDSEKAEGGYSLERINPSKNCGGRANWRASVSTIGGTPGTVNSVYSIFPSSNQTKAISQQILTPTNVAITYSDALEKQALSSVGIFLNPSNLIVGRSILGSNFDTLSIEFKFPLDSGKVYKLSIDQLQDCDQRTLTSETFAIGIGKFPTKNEIVINEILADETPRVGLPEAEFVELYNATDYLINLQDCRLQDANSKSSTFLDATFIEPKNYLIICSTSNVDLYKPFGATKGIGSFPSLNSTDDKLSLVSKSGIVIAKVNYSDTWYGDQVKKEGGWTLERVDPLNPCGTTDNWTASTSPIGGTPGKINAVFASNQDQTAPRLKDVFAIAPDTVLLYFSETIDSVSSLNSRITISNSIANKIVFVGDQQLKLLVNPPLDANITYALTLSNLTDCSGNYIAAGTSKDFYLTEIADNLDLIINEVLFNPKSGGSDFVEIYNRSKKYIDLKNWSLANRDDSGKVSNLKFITTDHHIINPNSFRLLNINNQDILNNYPRSNDSTFIVMEGMPTFPDDKGSVVLLNNKGKVSDHFSYSDDFHFRLIEKKEGVSLERIAYDLPTNSPESWQSASSTIGYATPGFKNSQFIDLAKRTNPIAVDPKIFTPDEDGWRDFTTISYQFSQTGNTASISIFDSQGTEVRKLVRNHLLGTSGLYQWDGLTNNGLKAPVGYYLVYVEVFDLQGNTTIYKESVVVGSK